MFVVLKKAWRMSIYMWHLWWQSWKLFWIWLLPWWKDEGWNIYILFFLRRSDHYAQRCCFNNQPFNQQKGDNHRLWHWSRVGVQSIVGCCAIREKSGNDLDECQVKCTWLDNLVKSTPPLHAMMKEIDQYVRAWML